MVRRERGELRRYCHLGTGNYDAATARQYEDVGLLTADEAIGADLSDLFNYLTGYSRRNDYRKLAVAPAELREQILKLIREASAAPGGRIAMKMNNLVDDEVIEALYEASSAGCEVDLLIRGICRLRPACRAGRNGSGSARSSAATLSTPGSSPSGRVAPPAISSGPPTSRPATSTAGFSSSARWRTRRWLARLEEILAVNLADTSGGWALRSEGVWARVEGRSTHGEFQRIAAERK